MPTDEGMGTYEITHRGKTYQVVVCQNWPEPSPGYWARIYLKSNWELVGKSHTQQTAQEAIWEAYSVARFTVWLIFTLPLRNTIKRI